MDIISIIGSKGGLGKTCIAVNIANYLAECGIETLLVDCDFNTNGSTSFMELNGLEINNDSEFKSLEVLLKRPLGNEFLYEIRKPEAVVKDCLFFVPTTLKHDSERISQFKEEDLHKRQDELDKVFEQWSGKYQIIILDHTGGYTDLAKYLLSFSSKVLLINADNPIGIRTARSLYKKLELTNQDIVQCVNRFESKPEREAASIIRKCYGLEENNMYKNALSNGEFLSLNLETINILGGILKNLLPEISDGIDALPEIIKKRNEKEHKISLEKKYKEETGRLLAASSIMFFILALFIPIAELPIETTLAMKILISLLLRVLIIILGVMLSIMLVYVFQSETTEWEVLWKVCKWQFIRFLLFIRGTVYRTTVNVKRFFIKDLEKSSTKEETSIESKDDYE